MSQDIFLGSQKQLQVDPAISGGFVERNGESFYRIESFDQMEPFFMTIVSNTDHWMFISSNGGLSAGRKNPDNALFPYYTVDKIQDNHEITGGKTILLVKRNGKTFLWEPFSDQYKGVYHTTRNLYKSVYGNKLVFEETNIDLGISFCYEWMNSEKFGFIRKSVCTNQSEETIEISFLDGIQNILPAGINRLLQQAYSNLVDAYKKNELIEHGIGLYMLSSVIVDKAEPSEALTTNYVWSAGLNNPKILLSSEQLKSFKSGKGVETEKDIRAARGAYFLQSDMTLSPGEQKQWHIVADVNKTAGDIAALQQFLSTCPNIAEQLEADVAACTKDLVKILASADGLQLTADKLSVNRHLANVLFNVMRGGIFDDQYNISRKDLMLFLKGANSPVFEKNQSFLESLEPEFSYPTLIEKAKNNGDSQFQRLCYEYLPLAFSRRHGDPSRPWNLFSIEMKTAEGTRNLNYQGNWRDIFQNWEALALSYPSFVESMISKFVNASTADGYNPYRITREGIDWEAPDPHDPWANIGYWGDHQIIYLQKFLEVSKKYHPGKLEQMLGNPMFAYANVPYRIKPYDQLVQNPFDTIIYDFEADKICKDRVGSIGSDGKLILNKKDEVLHVNFTEKILATVLAKLSNFIPDAGIWLNTQRPEWNDANNALVGNGVSMVTTYYLRRLQTFCIQMFGSKSGESAEVTIEMASFFKEIFQAFQQFESLLDGSFTNGQRKEVIDALGKAGSNYREKIYGHGFSGERQTLTFDEIASFFSLTRKFVDQTIRNNKRSDNLYHAYNLVSFKEDGVNIRHLYEMLEGQVAVLSAGILEPEEVNEILDALKSSAMFREDQYSYMLYPDRQLPRFTEKNIIPAEKVTANASLNKMIAENDQRILYKDVNGEYHFNGQFRNGADLKSALNAIEGLTKETIEYTLQIFESIFDHQSFTGRSGTFYGFEGLGCIYWHMVSKLVLAINENYFEALHKTDDAAQLGRMIKHYYDARAGIGLNKSPEVYGAFPTDAYSHTPGNGGAKQPGMTGQVKEDIISRFGELGVTVEDGKIIFNPSLLRKAEFLVKEEDFTYVNTQDGFETLSLPAGSLGFTFCQVPVVYHISNNSNIQVSFHDGSNQTIEGLTLNGIVSNAVFNRTGSVKQLDVYLNPRLS